MIIVIFLEASGYPFISEAHGTFAISVAHHTYLIQAHGSLIEITTIFLYSFPSAEIEGAFFAFQFVQSKHLFSRERHQLLSLWLGLLTITYKYK